MSFSVGILYSSQSFINFVKVNQINGVEFPTMFKKFEVADAKSVLNTSLRCNWITLNVHNRLEVTKLGEEILKEDSAKNKLRIQIAHLIEIYKPSWASLICYGRGEATKFFPPEVEQCFDEAGLLGNYDLEVIQWWDKLSSIVRGLSEDVYLTIGRYGERLSCIYEENRTHIKPKWQAIESNLSGYDILSQKSENETDPLRIEVKASSHEGKIKVHITRNEWEVASNSEEYLFHIWKLKPKIKLYILKADDIKMHIPLEIGNGIWEKVEICFTEEELELFNANIDESIIATTRIDKY
jgi:hypothetical protein